MAETGTPPSASTARDPGQDLMRLAEDVFGRSLNLLSADRATAAAALLDRWVSRRFHVLIVGEFKRGKSTLLNALIGEDLLPTGVPPVTTVPTRVCSGHARRALVHLQDGGTCEIDVGDVREYVDESRNPGNERGVASVEVELPIRLPAGVELVDVPGLGSVHRHNTETALAALPDADAVLVVASVDPPIGDAEVRLLAAARVHAARTDLVLNKVDYLDGSDRRTAEAFTRRALDDAGFPEVAIWPVSARDGLRARQSGDDLAWRRSGMHELAEALERFLSQERLAVLARSVAGKLGRLVAQESALLGIERAAGRESAGRLREIREALGARLKTAERDTGEAALVFRRRFDSILSDYSERAAASWKEPRERLNERLREMLAMPRRRRTAVSAAMRSAAAEAVRDFTAAFVPAEARRIADAYAAVCTDVEEAAAQRAEAVWRLAADLLPFEAPRVDPPSMPPPPRQVSFPPGSHHLLLDDLLDAAARLQPRGAALRRSAAQALAEADSGYGQAVEQWREVLVRAYGEHFRTLLAAHDQAAAQVTRAIQGALTTAEERVRALGGRMDADVAGASRRADLRELHYALQRIALSPPPGGAPREPGCPR
jgi:hypothetical protein